QHAPLGLLRVRGDRAAVPDEHPLVHGDQPRRPVARVALLERAADLRRALRARPSWGAPDPLGVGRRCGDPRGRPGRAFAAHTTRTARRLTWLTFRGESSRAPRPPTTGLRLHDRPDPRDLLRPDGDAAARSARPDD